MKPQNRRLWALAAVLGGCGEPSGGSEGVGATTGGSTGGMASPGTVGISTTSGAGGTSGGTPTEGSGGTTSGTSTSTSTSAPDSGDDQDGCGVFLCIPDGGDGLLECDPQRQDCRRGEKCSPVASRHDGDFDATRCVPVTGAGAPGDACLAMDSSAGLDDCGVGSVCWDLQADDHGVCVSLCTGSFNQPICAEDDRRCVVVDATLFVCRTRCDPRMPVCDPGQVCVPTETDFVCVAA